MRSLSRLLSIAVAAVAVLVAGLAWADPPSRVGRLALIEGSVLFRIDRNDTGQPATLNWPISSGAILDTDAGARAEVWIGSSTFRLAGRSRVEFATVDDRLTFLQLATGTLAITVRERDQADTLEVRTPDGRIQFGRAGRYRIDVAAGRTTVTSRAGIAYAYGSGRPLPVPEGRSAVIDGGEGTLYGELPADGFDAWAASRDAARDGAMARRYVSPEMTGYEDLDPYGDWEAGTEYGVVWYPRHVPAAWAPYRYGRWAWIAPWGWTWIDDAPWGFAPFHYGRWAVIGGRWAWVPGTLVPRPVYAPALVVWLGGGDWSIGVDTGPAIGWFPLGPREVFIPPYRATTPYLHGINTPHFRDPRHLDRMLVDQRDRHTWDHRGPRAVTVAPVRLLQEGRPVPGGMLQPDQRVIGRAPATRNPDIGLRPGPGTHPRPDRDGPPQPPRQVPPTSAISDGGSPMPAPVPRGHSQPSSSGPNEAPSPAPLGPWQQPAPVPRPHRAEPDTSVPAPAPWRREVTLPTPALAPARPLPPPVAAPPAPMPSARPPEVLPPRPVTPAAPLGTVPPGPSRAAPEPWTPMREGGWKGESRPMGQPPGAGPQGGSPGHSKGGFMASPLQ